MEAIALGLPVVRADLPLVDQRASVLMAIGERCLDTIQNGEFISASRGLVKLPAC